MSSAERNSHAGCDVVLPSSYVPASEDGRGRVATRDVVIDRGNGVSARLFLPSAGTAAAATTGGRRLPVVLYFHGGSFCAESAFCRTYHRYVSSLASRAGALVVSVECRPVPERPEPASYDDAWAVFRWVESLSDPWLAEYGDSTRTFVAGDGAGGNIAYHTVARASRENGEDGSIQGLMMVHPFLWGPDRQPYDDEIASLSCRRVLMAVAGRDVTLRDRGRRLASRMRCDVTLVESDDEDHGFHFYSPLRATSKKLMDSIVRFVNPPNPAPATPPPMRWPETILSELQERSIYGDDDTTNLSEILLGVPTRAYKAIVVDKLDKKSKTGLSSNTSVNASLTIRSRGKAWQTSYEISSLTRATYNYRGIATAGNQYQHPFRGVLW